MQIGAVYWWFMFNRQTVWILNDEWIMIEICGPEFDRRTVGPSLGVNHTSSSTDWVEWDR